MQSNCPFKIIHVHFPSNVRASHKFTTKKFVEEGRRTSCSAVSPGRLLRSVGDDGVVLPYPAYHSSVAMVAMPHTEGAVDKILGGAALNTGRHLRGPAENLTFPLVDAVAFPEARWTCGSCFPGSICILSPGTGLVPIGTGLIRIALESLHMLGWNAYHNS